MRILIAVPCMDTVAAPFAQSLATLHKVGDCAVSFLMGSLIYDSRNKLAAQAVKTGADYVMWLDSDMTFPADTITRLMHHLDKGADIATGLYFRRNPPYTPVIFSELDLETPRHADYNEYPSEPFEVAGCGFGCVLMRTEVIRSVALEYGQPFNPMAGAGEDLAFCWRARQTGAKIICDPAIKCGHVAHTIISEPFYQSYKAYGDGNDAE